MPENKTTVKGSLTIIGLGPGHGDYVTLEARELLANPPTEAILFCYRRESALIEQINPHLKISLLDSYSQNQALSPLQVIETLVRLLLESAFKEGRQVFFLTSGNALVINDLVLHLRRTAERYSLPIRIVPGLSFLDLVLEQVSWDAKLGLQLHSAWTIAQRKAKLDPSVPTLLYELGEADTQETTRMLESLSEQLAQWYPLTHQLEVLSSSPPPDLTLARHSVLLRDLARARVARISNLWLSPIAKDAS